MKRLLLILGLSLSFATTAKAIDVKRLEACSALQVFFLHSYEPEPKLDKILKMTKHIDFSDNNLRSNYLNFIDQVMFNTMPKFEPTCMYSNGQIDVECAKQELDYKVQMLKNDGLWNYHNCKLVFPKSEPSYSDLEDEIEELKDRIDELENN